MNNIKNKEIIDLKFHYYVTLNNLCNIKTIYSNTIININKYINNACVNCNYYYQENNTCQSKNVLRMDMVM